MVERAVENPTCAQLKVFLPSLAFMDELDLSIKGELQVETMNQVVLPRFWITSPISLLTNKEVRGGEGSKERTVICPFMATDGMTSCRTVTFYREKL